LITHIDAFLIACRAAHLSQCTLTWYTFRLKEFAGFVNGRVVTATLVREFLLEVESRGVSSATVHGYARTLKRFYRWWESEGDLADNPVRRVVMPRLPRRVPRGIDVSAFWQLLACCESAEWLDVRDRALLMLLRDTGCRASEIANVRVSDLEMSRGFICVLGKGGQERFAFVSPVTVAAVSAWLAVRDVALSGEWLFHSRRGKFTALTLNQMLRRRKREAGITGRVNPHSFRHAFARDWLRSGGDLASLSQTLGHKDLQTTMIYSTMATADLQEKHRKHSPLASVPCDS
jgi:site-specific recombinase XerD